MDEDTLSDYIERSNSLIDSSPQMDEQNTRTRLIDPFIRDVLGWDLYSTDIELEYSVQMGSSKKKADYALLLDGTPVVFIEAKGCDTSIENLDGQLRSYMQQEWVDWGLLTNGKRFKLFKLRKQASKPSVDLLGDSKLESLADNEWMIEALSKENIQSGRSHSIYEHIERRQRAIETLSAEKADLAEEIRELVVEKAGDVVSQPAESLSKSFIDEVIGELEAQSAKIDLPDEGEDLKDNEDGAYAVIFAGDSEDITITGKSQSDAMAKSIAHLIDNHNLIDKLPEFPYVPGERNAILNDEPEHVNGEKMRLFEELGNGYFVYTSLNKEAKQRYIAEFAEACDLSVDFQGSW